MHKRESESGHVGRWFQRHGYALDVRCPRFGDSLPPTLSGHAGAVIFGGPMSANDPDAYIKREIDWIGVSLAEGKPLLGICLGAQMLAKFLGARVARREDGLMEVGYHPIEPCCGAMNADWPRRVYQWHGEGFDLPAGAKALARGDMFENQAFRYGASAFGVQFHPEMTLAMINRWTAQSLDRFSGPRVQNRREQIQAHDKHGPFKRRWLDAFLSAWLKVGGAPA